MSPNIKILLTLIGIFSAIYSNAEQISNVGQGDKLIEFFPPSVYMGDVQVWDVKGGEDGYVFFASSEGLSVYDGVRWMKLSLSKGLKPADMRTLFYDKVDKRLYCGGDNYLGYWIINQYGEFIYTDIYRNKETERPKMFWRIGRIDNTIYFGAKESIFKYNLKNGDLTHIDADKGYHFMHLVDSHVFVQEGSTLYQLINEKKEPLSVTFSDRITAIFKDTKSNELLFFREDKGLFLLSKDNKLREMNSKTNIEIGGKRIFSVAKMPDGSYLVGTILGGLYHLDTEGNIIRNINKANGLPYVSVLNVSFDSDGNIWMGLEGGVAKMDNVPGESYLIDYKENIGGVYSVLYDKEKLYIGTNKGVFVRDEKNNYHLISGTQGQAWSIVKINSEIFACHDTGILRLNGLNSEAVLKGDGVWGIKEIPFKRDYYISNNYQGFNLLKVINGKLVNIGSIKNFKGEARIVSFDKQNFLWVMATGIGFYRFTLSDNLELTNSKLYTVPNMTSSASFLVTIDNEVIFYAGGKPYKYDILTDTLVKDDYADSLLKQCGSDVFMFSQYGNVFWYIAKDNVGYILRNHNQLQVFNKVFSGSYNKRIPKVFQNVFQLSDSTFAYGLQNRIGIQTSIVYPEYDRNIKFGTIEIYYDQENPVYADLSNPTLKLPYMYQKLKIYLVGLNRNKLIEYRITGESKEWTQVSSDKGLEIMHLKPGSYNLEIRNYGGDNNPPLTLNIEVAAPWYLSPSAICGYIIILLSIFVLIHFISRRQTKKIMFEKERLHQIEIEKYEKEKLAAELMDKDKKLASFMMLEISKNNLLAEIKEQLTNSLNSNNLDQSVNACIKHIDKQLDNSEDWRAFFKYFNNIHNGAFDRLVAKHPNLTMADMKLCAYLKLNLSTKEMSALLNISPASVDTARYRLRKKLNLQGNINLSTYLASI